MLSITLVVASAFLSGAVSCSAGNLDIYVEDEAAGLNVPDEFKLKYQVPEAWLLNEDESDLFGARSSWRGYIGVNYRYFFKDALFPTQSEERNDVSLLAEPEYSLIWPGGNLFVFSPYLQYDSQDDKRTHADLREMYFSTAGESYELSLGVEKVFWGVTESQNLVDIINQSDLVANGERSDKLGQPMVNLSLLQDWGTVDFFVMPYFRERTYAGEDGRLRVVLPIDSDHTVYESDKKEYHTDVAVRYSHYLAELEFALSYFKGTSREPDIRADNFITLPGETVPVPTRLYPYYYQMDQVGVELLYILGGWLLKGELVYRSSDITDYTAWTTGFEYIIPGIFGSEADFSIMSEWLYDDRRELSPLPFENDIMVGGRFSLNDLSSSEITVAIIQDLDKSPTMLSIEASRRLTDHWKLNLDVYWWWEDQPYDIFYSFRNDDFISCTLSYYF